MKITVIYGDHTTAARKRFNVIIDAIKKRGWEIITLTAGKASISEQLTHSSLFGDNQLFVIENAKQFSSSDITWIAKNISSIEGNVLIYHEGAMPAKLLNLFKKNGKLEKFDYPKIIFNFLESLYPGNAEMAIKGFHQVIEHEPAELVFALIATTLRDLYVAQVDTRALKLPDWRLKKISRQAGLFEREKLVNIIDKLAEIDLAVKSSQAGIVPALDRLIAIDLQ